MHVSYPPTEWYPGHEVKHSYCPKCRKDVTATVVREATLTDKTIPELRRIVKAIAKYLKRDDGWGPG